MGKKAEVESAPKRKVKISFQLGKGGTSRLQAMTVVEGKTLYGIGGTEAGALGNLEVFVKQRLTVLEAKTLYPKTVEVDW